MYDQGKVFQQAVGLERGSECLAPTRRLPGPRLLPARILTAWMAIGGCICQSLVPLVRFV